jgi:cell fate (sporulation/competence/biofilm development) regulator YmcA (YheA/YmcA/DUF963 family)
MCILPPSSGREFGILMYSKKYTFPISSIIIIIVVVTSCLSRFQDSFAHHSEQQAALAQNLVGKMKQLQEANINMASCEQNEALQQSSGSYIGQQVDAINVVQDLSTQLLSLVCNCVVINETNLILSALMLYDRNNIFFIIAYIRTALIVCMYMYV